ncbi:hypothetical protein VST7929_01259 [Vibrio stylophorae]|uniref:AttH domain-containing protein n=1 Tax=Vibrio stylophorae TaxID=659351 RepID=A0ABM8ZSW5_9VIBR|nr:lipocalin-like domain-containing protein [Vibrio stylophorae]CAH0533393.1 hypothetical protein VST7929_01259 [Vibrio stylophorae]
MRVFIALILSFCLVGCFDEEPKSALQLLKIQTQMSTPTGNFEQPSADRPVQLPFDHGPHFDYRHEWWSLHANLVDEQGNHYGLRWLLLRYNLNDSQKKGWATPHLYISHFILTDEDEMVAFERFARGGIGQSGSLRSPFTLWIDDWQWQGEDEMPLPATLNLKEKQYQLSLEMDKAPFWVAFGDHGYMQTDPQAGHHIYWVGAPKVHIQGQLKEGNKTFTLTGMGWFDHQWSSNKFNDKQLNWERFSLHLSDGRELLIARLRDNIGRTKHQFGFLIEPNGKQIALNKGDFQLKAEGIGVAGVGKRLPLIWRIRVPEYQIDIRTDPLHDRQWSHFSIPFWDGPVFVTGSHTGKGFMELTGY